MGTCAFLHKEEQQARLLAHVQCKVAGSSSLSVRVPSLIACGSLVDQERVHSRSCRVSPPCEQAPLCRFHGRVSADDDDGQALFSVYPRCSSGLSTPPPRAQDSFYEWHDRHVKALNKTKKQPYFIYFDGVPYMLMAGL